MHTAQITSPRFNYQAPAPARRTLDDLRMVHDNYATVGSFSARAMRPVWITALVIAALAGATSAVNMYQDRNIARSSAAAIAANPTVPSAASVPAISSAPAPTDATTARDSPATDPLRPLTRSAESTSMPMAGQANNHSSESMNPVTAKRNVPAKAAPAMPRKIAPAPSAAENVLAQPLLETATLLPPAAPIVDTPPSIPASVPDSPPIAPPKL